MATYFVRFDDGHGFTITANCACDARIFGGLLYPGHVVVEVEETHLNAELTVVDIIV